MKDSTFTVTPQTYPSQYVEHTDFCGEGWEHCFLSACLYCATVKSVCVLVTQSCPTPCNPMDCSLPGSSAHGILQERKLEWVAISFSTVKYVGEQNLTPQYMPLWHVDYCELKTIKAQKTQEEPLTFPLTA